GPQLDAGDGGDPGPDVGLQRRPADQQDGQARRRPPDLVAVVVPDDIALKVVDDRAPVDEVGAESGEQALEDLEALGQQPVGAASRPAMLPPMTTACSALTVCLLIVLF